MSGCFIIGFFVTYASGRWVSYEAWRYIVPVGFVGAYTTFSTYQWETLKLIEEGHWGRALLYVLGYGLTYGIALAGSVIAIILAENAARKVQAVLLDDTVGTLMVLFPQSQLLDLHRLTELTEYTLCSPNKNNRSLPSSRPPLRPSSKAAV